MDTDYYAHKIESMLEDKTTYQECSQDRSKKIIQEIQSLVKEANLPKNVCEYATHFELKPSNIYGLPKVHKSKVILDSIENQKSPYIEALCPVDLTFRPIVAGPSCATHRLSKMIDSILKPYTGYVKSYIRDDIDFLQKLPRNTAKDGLLVTFDVVSLYTNIDHDLGIEAIEYWMKSED